MLQADTSTKMDGEPKSPKKLRKILPRPRNSQLLIFNQPNVSESDPSDLPKLRSLLPNSTPPPLITNVNKKKEDNVPQTLPNIMPLNNSLPPLAVINQQGVKINVVKAVWVPNAPISTPDTAKQGPSKNSAQTAKVIKSGKNIEVISVPDDSPPRCRLCGKAYKNINDLIDIFGSEGKTAKLQEKVRRCLPISIKQVDKLPSTICKECVTVLDLSFKLIITAIKTDQQLRNELNRQEKRIENLKRSVEIAKLSKQPEVVTLDNSVEETPAVNDNPHLTPGHPYFDHSYILREDRGKELQAENTSDTPKSQSTPSKGDKTRSPSIGLNDSTECNICGKLFHDIEVFLKHVENDHVGNSSPEAEEKRKDPETKDDTDEALSDVSLMNCYKCKEICLDDEDLQFHLNYECVVCDICGLKSRSRRAYVLHLKKHHELSFEEIQGGKAGVVSKDGGKKTNAEPKEKASEIEDDSNSVGELPIDNDDDKREEATEEEKKYECPTCHKVYSNRGNFDKHRKLHDPLGLEKDVKTFQCEICSRSYNRHDNLLKHMKLHRPRELWAYSCSWCEEKFETRKDKVLHEKEVHSVEYEDAVKEGDDIQRPKDGRLWICGYCGKGMSSKLSLTEHERIHTGAKPCVCEYCGRCFRTKTNLNQHVVVHTRERNFPCPICGRGFSRKSFVRQHVRVHTGEKPFVCDICGKQFSQSGDMGRHRKKHGALEVAESAPKKRKLDETSSDEATDSLDSKSEVMMAVSSVSELAEPYQVAALESLPCEFCLRDFAGVDELRDHQLNDHADDLAREEEVKQYVLVVPS